MPQQILKLPLVGTMNLATLDPVRDHGYNETLVMNMLYSGLVRTDKNLNVIPDQATWQLSADSKMYTFTFRSHVAFSDGTPITAQSYVSTWTRALLLATTSSAAFSLLSPILGADDVHSGKAQTLAGVKALNDSTLQVTLTKPASYFLASLTNPLFFPLNQKLVARYGRDNWPQSQVEVGLGSGPFILKMWQPTVQLIFVPNPHYYGRKAALTMVVASFVNDPRVAFKLNGVGQTDLVWNITPDDQLAARSSAGFMSTPLLQTDMLFANTTKPPFDSQAVRQAFARAIDRRALISSAFNDALVPSATLLPPTLPGYQANEQAASYDAAQARSLLRSAYPDLARFPAITFSYPAGQVSDQEATTLQSQWQGTLGVQIHVHAIEPNAYQQEMQDHVIQLGFYALHTDVSDPYAFFSPFLSSSGHSNSLWHDTKFEQIVAQAEEKTGEQRFVLYQQAEIRMLDQAAIMPLDHQTLAAIIPAWVHGVTLNGSGLYFGDWSDVVMLRH
ncbi:MAG: peptide ABC transporter substrate-binding protein [Ktedonobacteraceae bacterium]|nr:peptide ABC transporter substrate-binding protein [Ktedonobacteraceae bacterium]